MLRKAMSSVLLCVLLTVFAVVLVSQTNVVSAQTEVTIAPDPTEDSSLWRFGFYFNPDDPRINVPKRNGLGTTLNLGHPLGRVILGLVAVMIAGLTYFKYRGKQAKS